MFHLNVRWQSRQSCTIPKTQCIIRTHSLAWLTSTTTQNYEFRVLTWKFQEALISTQAWRKWRKSGESSCIWPYVRILCYFELRRVGDNSFRIQKRSWSWFEGGVSCLYINSILSSIATRVWFYFKRNSMMNKCFHHLLVESKCLLWPNSKNTAFKKTSKHPANGCSPNSNSKTELAKKNRLFEFLVGGPGFLQLGLRSVRNKMKLVPWVFIHWSNNEITSR